MVTLTEVKAFLQIGDSAYDTIIGVLIPSVTAYILEETKNQFKQTDFYTESTSLAFVASTKKITLTDMDDEGFLVNDWIVIEGSKYNNITAQISVVNTNDLVVLQTLLDEDAENNTRITRAIYDSGIKQIASEMIGYDINNTKFEAEKDVTQESLGDASKTYGRVYPERITNKLKSYNRATGR